MAATRKLSHSGNQSMDAPGGMEIFHVSAGRAETSQPVYVLLDSLSLRRFGPPLDLLGRDIFDMGCDPPLIAKRVLDGGGTVAIELVGGLTERLTSRLDGTLIDSVHIFHVEVKHGQEGLKGLPAIAHHNDRISDFDLGVHHRSVWKLRDVNLGSAKRLLREIDQLGHARDHDIRNYRVVALGNWFYFGCHEAIVTGIAGGRIV